MRDALFLSVDGPFFPLAVFTAHSAKANATARPFDTFIAVPENSVDASSMDWAERNVGAVTKEIRAADLDDRIGFDTTASAHISVATCYRYLFDLFLPSRYERLIYLDADIRVLHDISPLFTLDLGPHAFAASADGVVHAHHEDGDRWTRNYIGLLQWDTKVPFANSGMLVIDPSAWLRLDLGRRVLDTCRRYHMVYPCIDQDSLNIEMRGDFQVLSPVWNMLAPIWLGADLYDVVDPAVLHYVGPRKPWKPYTSWPYHRGETAQYRQFFARSPWPEMSTLRRDTPTVKQYARYLKRRMRETIAPWWAPRRYSLLNVERYREHIRTFDFADKRQGLIACDAAGVLRPAVG